MGAGLAVAADGCRSAPISNPAGAIIAHPGHFGYAKANIASWIKGPCCDQGRPRCPTEAVVETLRFSLREIVQWRELRAIVDRVCGATLRRRFMEWSTTALLRRVHAALVRMARSGPEAAASAWDVVIDSCSVRAKRGGELPSQTRFNVLKIDSLSGECGLERLL
jgi:transposase